MALTQVSRGLLSTSIVDNGNATAITIDSSENVLVGKTSLAIANEGIVFENGGAAEFTTDSARVMRLNRTSDDGSVLEINKDGSTVGSIATISDDLTIFSTTASHVGLRFGNTRLQPTDNAGATSDGVSDLGFSNSRFKDFYLSGDIAHKDAADNARLLYDKSSNLLGNAGTNGTFATVLVGRTSSGATGNGHTIRGDDSAIFSRDSSGESMIVARNASAGDLVRFYCNGVDKGSINFDGSNTISYTSSSDQRLKENIADADDAGSKVDAIQVRKFDWIADGSHQDYGMVAQELQSVAPEAVSGDAGSDEMMGVDYSKLVPMLVKEIQSLRARVAQLENN